MPRPSVPTNEHAIFKLSEPEARLLFPLHARWVPTQALVNPEDNSIFVTVRDDGEDPDEQVQLSSQRIFFAGDLNPERCKELAQDFQQFAIQQGIRGIVGFFSEENEPMQVLDCKPEGS
jgi:hypothetical protein